MLCCVQAIADGPPGEVGGEGVVWGPGQPQSTQPPHIRNVFLKKNIKFTKGARNWRAVSGTQTVFWRLTPPPYPHVTPA